MSDYQQDQAGWEWRDQEDERWQAENITGFEGAATQEELVACRPMIDSMLANFDQIFMNEGGVTNGYHNFCTRQ